LAVNETIPEIYNENIIGVNPAAVGLWHSLQNAEDWRLQLGVIYGVVVDGLGKELVNQIAF
jgi:hypothetical protein